MSTSIIKGVKYSVESFYSISPTYFMTLGAFEFIHFARETSRRRQLGSILVRQSAGIAGGIVNHLTHKA
jgi:hypothetical protein